MKILNLVNDKYSNIKYKISKFPDGQQNVVLLGANTSNISSNSDLSLIKGSITIKSRLNNWLDLELIVASVASLRELGVEEICLYVPYIMGARSDRKFEEGGNNYLKDVICPVINSLNFKTVTCIDPHSDVLEACIKGFRKESNEELVSWAIGQNICKGEGFSKTLENCILVSPDAGATKKIYKLAEQIGYKGNIITCSKDRDKDGKLTKITVPFKDTGPLCKKDYIIIDDICDGGATFVNIAEELRKAYNCNHIYLIVTHGIFSKGFSELVKYFDGIYCTNSYSDIQNGYLSVTRNYKPFVYMIETKNFVKQLNVFLF